MLKPVLQPQKPSPIKALTVSQLNRQVKGLLEGQISSVILEGEVSNFIAAGSGHWYFSLKDSQAQVRCTCWKGRNQAFNFRPKDGDAILVRAKVTLYEARGEYQLTVETMQPQGLGNLQWQFEELKRKLDQQGFFAPELKKTIANINARIGVITSSSGAALRDIIHVIERRYPLCELIVYPSLVQGQNAHNELIAAIELANQRNEVDVLLLTRGGGSLEDLWCFNHEQLAYAIVNSELPIVSAVGHEVDFTIADFVADLRAPTPSAAAEILTPDQYELRQTIDELLQKVSLKLHHLFEKRQLILDGFRAKIKNPEPVLQSYQQQILLQIAKAEKALSLKVNELTQKLNQAAGHLQSHHPEKKLLLTEQKNQNLHYRLIKSTEQIIQRMQMNLASQAKQLNAISPLATLDRGYSISLIDNKVITDSTQVKQGQRLTTRLSKGTVISVVESVDQDEG